MLEKAVTVVEKVIKVFDTSKLKAGDAYLMTVGDHWLDIFDDVLSAGGKVFILIESFNENEIKAAYVPRPRKTSWGWNTERRVQRFIITPDMDVTLERVVE